MIFITKGVQLWQDNNIHQRKNPNLSLKQFEVSVPLMRLLLRTIFIQTCSSFPSKWKREAETQLYTLFQDNSSKERKAQKAREAEINDLYAQIGKLTTQNEWLKKKSGF